MRGNCYESTCRYDQVSNWVLTIRGKGIDEFTCTDGF